MALNMVPGAACCNIAATEKEEGLVFLRLPPVALPVTPYVPAVCPLDGYHSLDKISPCYMFRVSLFLVDSLLLQDLKRGLRGCVRPASLLDESRCLGFWA